MSVMLVYIYIIVKDGPEVPWFCCLVTSVYGLGFRVLGFRV